MAPTMTLGQSAASGAFFHPSRLQSAFGAEASGKRGFVRHGVRVSRIPAINLRNGVEFMMKSLFAAAMLAIAAVTAAAPAPRVEMRTSLGEMLIELDAEKAPVTVGNFLNYVNKGYYDGTVFHRVIDGFMIQGGGFTPSMEETQTGEPIRNEAKNGLKNRRGTIAMARRSDPHSATAQFFINHRDNAALDHPGHDGWGYAVFGRVVRGIEVLDAIAKVPTGRRGGHQDVPLEPVIIQSVKLLPGN
jgi:cyclophilin family peptidyl-prolyl cis-trans isomerase